MPNPNVPPPGVPTGLGNTPPPSATPSTGNPMPSQPPAQHLSGDMSYFAAEPQMTHSITDHHRRGIPIVQLLAVIGILLLVVAFYNLVVATRPGGIWKTALGKTNTTYEQYVNYGTQDLTGGTLKGDYQLEGEVTIAGNLNMEFYKGNADFTFNIGQPPTRATIVGRLVDAPLSNSPDFYFRATGLKNLATVAPDYAQALADHDNQWLSVDHTLFDTIKGRYIKNQNTNADLSATDINKVFDSINKVNKDYVFSTKSGRAVFQRTKNVGKKQLDGRTVYHYQAKLHQKNTKDYLNALADALQKSPAVNFSSNKNIRESLDLGKWITSAQNAAVVNSADVYVDMKTKSVSKIRFTDAANRNNYLEVSFQQQRADVLPFSIKLRNTKNGKESNLDFTMGLNTKTKLSDITFALQSKPANSKGQKLSGKFTLTPSNKEIKVVRPNNNRPLLFVGAPASGKSLGSLFGTFKINIAPGENVAAIPTPEGEVVKPDDGSGDVSGDEDIDGDSLGNEGSGDPGTNETIGDEISPGNIGEVDDPSVEDDGHHNCSLKDEDEC